MVHINPFVGENDDLSCFSVKLVVSYPLLSLKGKGTMKLTLQLSIRRTLKPDSPTHAV